MDFIYGIGGIILFALNVWALINVIGSGASTLEKILWGLGIWIFPLIGFIAWFLAGPRKAG